MTRSTQNALLLAVTSPLAWVFYKGAVKQIKNSGLNPVLLSAPGANLEATAREEGVSSLAVAMQREIAPLQDLKSLWNLHRLLRKIRPAIVDASTPKAGLLVTVASALAGVPHRVYSLRGLRLETAQGIRRKLLWGSEWMACACSHRVVCLSESLRHRAIALKLVTPDKTIVLQKGSSGVDLNRFVPGNKQAQESQALLRRLGIPVEAPVVGFVGRLVKDKGIRELVEAFQKLRPVFPGLRLLLIGDFEAGDPVESYVRAYLESTPAVIRTGFIPDAAPYYRLMDVLAFPTHREGFGQVSLEAQASGVPVVTTRATGAIDSVVDGVTGVLVPVGDCDALATAIAGLLRDGELRMRMGRAGRNWMELDFRPESIWNAQIRLYQDLLSQQPAMTTRRQRRFMKRAFDLTVSSLLLFILWPLFILVAGIVLFDIGRPILFRQKRLGLDARPFTLLKFRTMTYGLEANGDLSSDAKRLTAVGRFLRSTSLDELPELINVILGEMSLVGPRPLLARYLERYTPEQMKRHAAKPGISGWAQVNGRNTLDWDHKFALDLWYVEHQSLALDLTILAKTVWQVLKREGTERPGHATMPEFFGVASERKEV